ncbi:hypothetical protein ACJ41O_006138 [Fusarium nematophilum]
MAPSKNRKRQRPVAPPTSSGTGTRQGSILTFFRPKSESNATAQDSQPADAGPTTAALPPPEPKRPQAESPIQAHSAASKRPDKKQRVDEDEDDEADNNEYDDDEDPDWVNTMDPALLDDEDDLEELLDGLDGTKLQKLLGEDEVEPVAQAGGLIRVGPQPFRPQKFVRSAPRDKAEHSLRQRDGPGTLSRVCDYTGLQMAWSAGPFSVSMEAVYVLVVSGGRIAYHANPNVHLILHGLNISKGGQPPIMMPVVASWLNSLGEPDFEKRKAQLSWAFNAIANSATLCRVFHLSNKHASQVKLWSEWSLDKLAAVLEALRTGVKTTVVNQALARYSEDELFRPRSKGKQRYEKRVGHIQQGQKLYDSMLGIAQKYGLSEEEFEYYFTISAPTRKERVFYPFHVLSRPQAEAYGWDWWVVIDLCSSMVCTLKTGCNKHAEAAGHGEKGLNATTMAFFLAHFFCDKVKALKVSRPDATKEEILFHILDRWGLPIVPWKVHPFKASVCKKDDHGIAMKVGLTSESGDIDPINGIDLTKSTVAVDTWFTNKSMHRWATADWESIRSAITAVPLHHSFWRVDPALGSTIWKGS